MNKKVSIIIPVYNAEKYIEKCLSSVVNQTLKEIEIIVINDGSTDNSQDIINKYKENYPELIKAKTIENVGVAKARNKGLEMAEGKYVGFVDSDDYIEETMYEKLYNKAQEENADIVVSAYYKNKKDEILEHKKGNLEQYNKSIKENPNIFLDTVPYLWNKIFKRELITQNCTSFSKLDIFEDLVFTYKLYIHANKISKVDEALYYYITKDTTSLTANFSEKFLDIIPAIKELKEYFKQNNCYEDLEDYLIYISLKHIYIRCNKKISFKQLKLKLKYIDKVFAFLDAEFSNWKKHEIYFIYEKRDKKRYISKEHWKLKTYMQVTKILPLFKLIFKRTNK